MRAVGEMCSNLFDSLRTGGALRWRVGRSMKRTRTATQADPTTGHCFVHRP